MFQSIAQVRKWLVGSVCVLIAAVTISYWVARSRVQPVLHNVPQQLGIDIQQTSDGFTLSKSEGGRTIYTIKASKAVQFKKGGHAELKNVDIVVYGKNHDRYDQIYGDHFTYDQATGEIKAVGEVHIDLQGNAEGPSKPDQAPPAELKNPLHLVTRSLTFNQKTGIAETDDVVNFTTEQAQGSAKGAYYDSKQNELQLKSDIHVVTTGEKAAVITGSSGVIQKNPRQAVLMNARIEQPDRTLTADKGTLVFSPDNTVQHVIAEGNVHVQSRGPSVIDVYGPRGDLNMGAKNTVDQAIVSGGARFDTQGSSVAHGSADTFIVDFEGKNEASKFHMIKNARMKQDPQPGKSGSAGQPMEIAADQLNFQLANGNELQTADTVGKAAITILPSPSVNKQAKSAKAGQEMGGSNSTTVATAGKFHATFDNNRIQTLHGWPNSKIVSSAPGEPDKTSIADKLDVTFAAEGGVQKLIQSGNFEYHEPSPNPQTGGRSAFADMATYTPNDEILVLTGSPRVIDGGMTTTAVHVRMNRQSGEGFADDDVKTTYSDLKPQPDGALLANSDPIHVTAQHMTATKQPGIAHYTGNVRLWQTANVVRAPKMDFDNVNRSILAESDKSQTVSSLFMQQSQDGKLTPVDVTADKLTYVDEERRARYTGNVLAKSPTAAITTDQLDIYLKQADLDAKDTTANAQKPKGPSLPGSDTPSQIDHMVAIGRVVVTEPNRRAVGDRLVYTADDAKYLLTGKSPSIFDAEHGTVWGDSLTFYTRDDRVLVESKRSSPTITRARTTK
ncbi:MAG TPA: LPS export ABC transporter periplasmic protein LptC [Terriglobales bacterium]|jgi:lipopolysaccharide export system protein LptA